MLGLFDLSGKVAIVTGARKGLGFGMAEAGADVVGVVPIAMPELEKSVTALGRRFLFVEADLTSQEKVSAVVSEAVKKFGSADILVNNAGIIRRAEGKSLAWRRCFPSKAGSVFLPTPPARAASWGLRSLWPTSWRSSTYK